jgi:hypothetical protein
MEGLVDETVKRHLGFLNLTFFHACTKINILWCSIMTFQHKITEAKKWIFPSCYAEHMLYKKLLCLSPFWVPFSISVSLSKMWNFEGRNLTCTMIDLVGTVLSSSTTVTTTPGINLHTASVDLRCFLFPLMVAANTVSTVVEHCHILNWKKNLLIQSLLHGFVT